MKEKKRLASLPLIAEEGSRSRRSRSERQAQRLENHIPTRIGPDKEQVLGSGVPSTGSSRSRGSRGEEGGCRRKEGVDGILI